MLIARFLVGIRAPVYVMTGVVRLPFRLFLLYDVISATLVVGTVFGLSYMFGEQVTGWVRHAETRATIVVLLIVIAVLAILYYRHKEQVINYLFGGETPPTEN
jgi:membrane protein DedA with SNARE-associated domain